MLVLSRKPGEKLVIGEGITVTVVEIKGPRVKIAIDAPDSTRVVRGELAQCIDLFLPSDSALEAGSEFDLVAEEEVCPDLVVSDRP
jgi:carbon storage regulator CsrA